MNKLLIGLFLCFIGGMGILHLLAEDQHFSENENRVLSQMPKWTYKSFVSGKFTSDFEEYVNDQFVWKEFWTGIKADAEKLVLKQENNGVYFGKDGYLLEKYEKPDEQLQNNIRNVQSFLNKAKGIHAYFLLAPTSIEIYQDKRPLFAPSYHQKDVLAFIENKLVESVEFIPVYDQLLSKKAESIYFRTDHHWTMRGAFYAYEAAARKMGFTPYAIEDFEIEQVSDNFYGTFYSKAKDFRLKADKIELFRPKFPSAYQVQYGDNGKIADTLYEWIYLDKRDQYSFFLNGNHSLVKISSNVNNGRKLAVIKDSYAHAFIPFLANHFEEIHVIDLRYYHLNLHQYLKSNEISEVLFLYNISRFTNDPNLIWLQS